jgi:hypothetical protein
MERVKGAYGSIQRGDGLATTIHGNAVPQRQAVWRQTGIDNQSAPGTCALEGDDLSDGLNYSSKHL